MSKEYPVLIGRSAGVSKKLYDLEQVADFICEYGVYGEVSVETPSGSLLLTTYGIYLDRVSDMEYREKLLEITSLSNYQSFAMRMTDTQKSSRCK